MLVCHLRYVLKYSSENIVTDVAYFASIIRWSKLSILLRQIIRSIGYVRYACFLNPRQNNVSRQQDNYFKFKQK